MRKSQILPGLLAAALLAAAGCSNTDDADVPTLPADTAATTDANANVPAAASNVPADAGVAGDQAGAASNPLTVATSEGVEGTFLADSAGTALYFLEGDTDGSKCVDACTTTWPPFLVEGAMPSESAGLDAALVGVVTRPDGSTQVSYGDHPLYRYSGDAGAGSTAGHGVEDQWGHWYLVTPAGGELGG